MLNLIHHPLNVCAASLALATLSATPAPAKADQRLKVSANGRYFETANGKPWFWLGDTSWSMFTAYKPEEIARYIELRGKFGFTLIQMSPAFDGGTGTESGQNPNANPAGITPWANHDPLQPNEAFWKTVDDAVKVAEQNGIYIGLLPSWGSYVVNTKMITAQNAKAYGKWLGARYKNAPNIVWILGGDRKFLDAAGVWTALAEGVKEGDGGAHPITFHHSPADATPALLRSASWLSATMLQTWASYDKIPTAVSTDYHAEPSKPVILGEGAYEDGPEYPTKPITPLSVRKQAYWACLSGGFYTYGHNDMWRHNPTWEKSLSSPGAHSMKVLHEVFASLDWSKLLPAQEILGDGQGNGFHRNAAAKENDGSWALIYFSGPAKGALHLEGLPTQATWISPATGEQTDAGKIEGAIATPVGWEDALLEFKR